MPGTLHGASKHLEPNPCTYNDDGINERGACYSLLTSYQELLLMMRQRETAKHFPLGEDQSSW